MSFETKFKVATKAEAVEAIGNDAYLPGSIALFVMDAIRATDCEGKDIDVHAYGHLHNGEDGNYAVSTANITVQAVERIVVQTPETSAENGAAPQPETPPANETVQEPDAAAAEAGADVVEEPAAEEPAEVEAPAPEPVAESVTEDPNPAPGASVEEPGPKPGVV